MMNSRSLISLSRLESAVLGVSVTGTCNHKGVLRVSIMVLQRIWLWRFNLESGTSDRTVVPNQEGDESSVVFDPSIQASLPRTSIVSEIIEAKADPSPRMQPLRQTVSSTLAPAEDKQSSKTGPTSSPKKVNPFMKDPLEDESAIENRFSDLKKELIHDLQKDAVYSFLKPNNMTEAQKKVQDLFDRSEAIEHVIKLGEKEGMAMKRLVRETHIARESADQQNFKDYVGKINIYRHLFDHALGCGKSKLEDTQHRIGSDSMVVDSMVVDFMAFLINKVQEEDIKDPPLTFQKKYQEVTDYLHLYEEETISTVICLVNNDEKAKAKKLFKRLLNLMKSSDIINRGRIYNYTLQKAEELAEVHKFLSSDSLSQRYKDLVRDRDRLERLAGSPNQDEVRKFLVKLYFKDDNVERNHGLSLDFVEKHDYLYLIQCVWEYQKRWVPGGVQHDKWTPLQLNYVFTSSAAMACGEDIMESLLKVCPKLINARYKGIAALHVAVHKRNKKAIQFLLGREELEINLRTERGLTVHDVKKYFDEMNDLQRWRGVKYATVDADRKEMTKDLLLEHQSSHEENPSRILSGNAANRILPNIKSAGKKWNKNRWNLPTHQTAPHMATPQSSNEENPPAQSGDEENTRKILTDAADRFLLNIKNSGKKWNKNRWDLPTHQTSLHLASAEGNPKLVKLLRDAPDPHNERLRCHEEDEEKLTPLDIIYRRLDKRGKDPESESIERILLRQQDVQNGIDRLYRNRQVLVDAVNTVLVVAALIAGLAYAGWLQPPLGYAPDYDLAEPYPAPPDTYNSYLPVQGNFGVKVFALFNSLSFFFAIATVIVGADASFPTKEYQYIGEEVKTMRQLLKHAIRYLIISLVCVLGAFGSAAIVVLPPSLFFRKDMVLSIIVGGVVCGYAVWRLLSRHSERMKKINNYVVDIIKLPNAFESQLEDTRKPI